MKRFSFATILLSALLLTTSCGGSGEKLSGAGATFPAPFYNVVFRAFMNETGHTVNYGAIGSGGGIRSLQDRNADFGATDVFLSDAQLAEMPAEIIHIPTAMGAVVLSFNLPNGITELNLTSQLISEIYRGEITRWNDERLVAVNPDANLPDLAVTPIFRSDGSGTTFVFSDYMSKTDELWEVEIGTGTALNFPKGIAGKGNPGVAGIIAETVGSIGYIGSEYALTLNLPTATLQNSSSNFVKATLEAISASSTEVPADTRVIITNSSNPEAYPISTFTWIIAYKEQNYLNRTLERAEALTDLLSFIVGEEGQKIAKKSHYAPLSPAVVETTLNNIKSMTFNGERIAE